MSRRLRIAQVAPLEKPVSPTEGGELERVVSHLTDALVDAGHEVTLFASGDSRSRAELEPGCRRALGRNPEQRAALPPSLTMLESVYDRAREFDIVHSHLDYVSFPFARRCATPTVTTVHDRLDAPGLSTFFRQYHDVPLVSLSRSQREPLPEGPFWAANIHPGLPVDAFHAVADSDDYLACYGRRPSQHQIEAAARVASRTNRPLKIGMPSGDDERDHATRGKVSFSEEPGVEFVGTVWEEDKQEFLGEASALLLLSDTPEPFHLTMIEAMACGTPVLARNGGAVPEIVDPGVTGYVCRSEDEAVEAVERLDSFDRRACRGRFEERFRAARMADRYVRTYRSLTDRARYQLGGDHVSERVV